MRPVDVSPERLYDLSFVNDGDGKGFQHAQPDFAADAIFMNASPKLRVGKAEGIFERVWICIGWEGYFECR